MRIEETNNYKQDWEQYRTRQIYFEDKPVIKANDNLKGSAQNDKSYSNFTWNKPTDITEFSEELKEESKEENLFRFMIDVNHIERAREINRPFTQVAAELSKEIPALKTLEDLDRIDPMGNAAVEHSPFEKALELFKMSLLPHVPSLVQV